jgi:transcriptional regulator with XRE-family HTH domain
MTQVPLSQRERRELAYSPDTIGLALMSRRVAEGLSQGELARRIRVTDGTIANYEKGLMPTAASRVLSYVYAEAGHEELWRQRALVAEQALRQITAALSTYRGAVRDELSERANRNGEPTKNVRSA